MRVKAFSIFLLMVSGVGAMSQTADTNGVTLLTTNRFPDGSTIKVKVAPSLLWLIFNFCVEA